MVGVEDNPTADGKNGYIEKHVWCTKGTGTPKMASVLSSSLLPLKRGRCNKEILTV